MRTVAKAVVCIVWLAASLRVHAKTQACQEQASWLHDATVAEQNEVLIKVSSNVVAKFMQIVSAPNASKADQLWGYKILATSHYMLSQSPYASSNLKGLFSKMSDTTARLIRGEIKFNTFQSEMNDVDGKIDGLRRSENAIAGPYLNSHPAQIETLSNCILTTSMMAASTNPSAR